MPRTDLVERLQVLVGGAWQDSDGGDLVELQDPATHEVYARTVLGTPADVDRAVRAARASFDSRVWQDTPPAERAAVLMRASDILEQRIPAIAELVTHEVGCTYSFAHDVQVPSAIRHLRTNAELIRSYRFEQLRSDGSNADLIVKEAVGVVGIVTPWNGPLSSACMKLGPALVAGCSVVCKPSPETPVVLYEVADALIEAGLPAGVLSVVPGPSETGIALVGHPEVDKIAFTGSTAAGKHIAAACAQRIARVSLELGGKSAAIVLAGADVEKAAAAVFPTALLLSGQICTSHTRLLVHESIRDEFVDAVAAMIRGLVIGDPMDAATDIGPLVSEAQRERVESYIAIGRAEGARAVIGGGRPAGLDRGWFVEPTLFDGVDNSMRIAREEIFGPVVATIAFSDTEEAIRVANDSPYGLSGGVWGAFDEALAVARRIRTGRMSINGFGHAWGVPFGGYKQSGIGREYGPEGLEMYFETKGIAVGLDYQPGREDR